MTRAFGRIGRFLLAAWFVLQCAGVAIAIRTKRRVVPTTDPAADEVVLSAIFGQLDFASTADRFRGGVLYCLYGGGVLDLRGATLDPSGANLHVEAFNGGAQILVPASWDVRTKVIGLGGVGDSRPFVDRPAGAPQLTIEGSAMFGGFGIASQTAGEPETAGDEPATL
jgi:hypothetical protein